MTLVCANSAALPAFRTPWGRFGWLVIVAAPHVIGLGVSGPQAEPLPQERCKALAAELSLLEGGGAGENILKGPEWAKANLTPEQITYVRRLINVRENLLFRCRSFDVVRDSPPPLIAPAAAPVPGRRPEQPKAAANSSPKSDGVPPPVRPERLQAKAPGGDDQSKAKPTTKLRSTLPSSKNSADSVPPPERKAK